MAVTIGREALAVINLVLSQGADNSFSFVYNTLVGTTKTPVDLTGTTVRSQIRSAVGGALYLDLIPLVTLGGLAGTISLVIPAATTEPKAWNTRTEGVWDLELVSASGAVVRFATGTVTIVPDVTRV